MTQPTDGLEPVEPARVKVAYHREGSGEPLLLTHGIGERWQYWLPVLPYLTPHFDVVAVDLPGFATSPAFTGPVTPDAFDGALNGLIADLGWDRPHVSGISLGGYLALRLGAGGHARSVTAFSPAGLINDGGTRWAMTQLRTMRAVTRGLAPRVDSVARYAVLRAALTAVNSNRGNRIPAEVFAEDIRTVAYAPGWDPTLAMLRSTHFRAADTTGLAQIATTVAWGTGDKILRFSTVEKDRLPASVVWRRLPKCGHTPTWDDPELTARTIRDTVARSR